jgi:predicted  nucleic acid-binding Zn-ribbon protein
LSELTKYEVFLSELNSLETQSAILVERFNDLVKLNKELESQVNMISKENEYLKLQVRTMEKEVETFKGSVEKESSFLTLPTKDRESLKLKINELIARINYHLGSSS